MNKQLLIKYGIWAAIALVAVVAVIIIYNKTKSKIQDKVTEKQLDKLTELEIDEEDVTIMPTTINNLVAKLKTAFGAWGYATDEDAIYEVFEEMDTRSDVLKLVNTFGVHKGHTLNEWMNKELSYSELEHVQEILQAKGIVYTF